MSDLISRQAAKEKACSICRWEGTENCAECEHPIDDLPIIDAVPVVRCKDCKYSEHWYKDKRRCFFWVVNEVGIGVFEDGFCNYAERKEND